MSSTDMKKAASHTTASKVRTEDTRDFFEQNNELYRCDCIIAFVSVRDRNRGFLKDSSVRVFFSVFPCLF